MIEKLHTGMAAVRRVAAVTMTAALLTGPVAVPNQRPGRPRPGFCPWHAIVDWLGNRRRERRQ